MKMVMKIKRMLLPLLLVLLQSLNIQQNCKIYKNNVSNK
jgi:hypothetical protein